MPKYVIERERERQREIPGAGDPPVSEREAVSQKSREILSKMGPHIQWLHSYVTADKVYCAYLAPDEKAIQEQAREGGFPANRASRVASVIDAATAE